MMRPWIACFTMMGLLGVVPLWAQEAPTTQPAAVAVPVAAKLQYRPPNRDAPQLRISGGVRGNEKDMPAVSVLAPPHVGLCLSAQPTLYWHLDKDTDRQALVTVLREDTLETVLRRPLPGPHAAGFHGIKLAEHGLTLEPGVSYSWSVALIPADRQRPDSQDPLGKAVVQRVAPEDPIFAAVDQAPADRKLEVMAAQGVWYDVLAVLTDSIAAAPQSHTLLQARATLLGQVGLDDLARRERAAATDLLPSDGK